MSKPFFIKSEDIPGDERVDTQRGMICKGIEKVIGKKNLKAAQKLGRKWILNAIDEDCRNRIITTGRVEVGRMSVAIYATDPFAVLGPDGKERETTKLIIDGVPLQEGEVAIKKRLEELGVIFCAKDPIKLENHFDAETKTFSELLTGRRFAYIVLPENELPKTIKIGPYMARLYYRQMAKELPACRNCNEKGHWTNQCPKPRLCYDCKQPGHKKGDAHCPLIQSIFEEVARNENCNESDKEEDDSEGTDESESEAESVNESCDENSREENVKEKSEKKDQDEAKCTDQVNENENSDNKKTEGENVMMKEADKAKKDESRGRTQSSMEEFVERMRSVSRKRGRSPPKNMENGKDKGASKKAKKAKNDKKKTKK